jgi:large subunit ribosomal protein L27
MAHKKSAGTSLNGRDSNSKRRGVKRFGGQIVDAGEILVRQKGFNFRPGQNVHVGTDWTLHSDVPGTVRFSQKRLVKFNGRSERCTIIHIDPIQ